MNSGVMMKLIIKIRGIKIGTLITSMLKPRRAGGVVVYHEDHINNTTSTSTNKTSTSSKSSESVEYYRRLFMKPLDKWLMQRNRDINYSNGTSASSSNIIVKSGGDRQRYTKMMMNVNGAVRGVLRAVSFNKVEFNNNGVSARSCPSSIKSSPLHDNNNGRTTRSDYHNKLYARENSIQAAIAHCKSSFST